MSNFRKVAANRDLLRIENTELKKEIGIYFSFIQFYILCIYLNECKIIRNIIYCIIYDLVLFTFWK